MANHVDTARRQITEIVTRLLADDRQRGTAVLGYASVLREDSAAQRAVLSAVVAALPRRRESMIAEQVPDRPGQLAAEIAALANLIKSGQKLSAAEEERLHLYVQMSGHQLDVSEIGG